MNGLPMDFFGTPYHWTDCKSSLTKIHWPSSSLSLSYVLIWD